ncbi:MAG: magnesium/cobalt transporter CorA [Candidatus Omnitrophota bacterium]
MAKSVKMTSHKTALPPGALIHIGEKKTERIKVTLVDYNETECQEKELKNIQEAALFKDKPTVTWIAVVGLHETGILEEIGAFFDLHPLLLEDILDTGQRPKIDDYGTYFFILLKMLDYDEKTGKVITEQVSLVFGKKFVISFQEKESHLFNIVKERIRDSKGRVRKQGADYLAYVLLDAIVDNYFLIIEKLGERVEVMEEELMTDPGRSTLQGIHALKSNLIYLRRSVWPFREVINSLLRETELVTESTHRYLTDVYDHTIRIIDSIETFRDMVSGMIDIYLSSVSNKMNEVMKVLTIIATIFIPLTFITGLYGMNFADMPELKWRYGYFVTLGIMAFMGITMWAYFKKKKWF